MAKKIRKTGAMGAEISVAPDAKKAIKEATQSAEKLTKEAKQTTASTHATTKNIEASVIQESRLRRELEGVANVEAKINRLLALRQKYLYPNGGIFPHPRGNAPLTPAERQARSRAYRRGAAVNVPKQAYGREPYNVNSTADPYASSRLAFERWRNTRRMLTNVGEAEARKLAMRNMRNALPAGMQNMAASMARELGAETAKYRQGYLGSIKNNADLIRLRTSLPEGMKNMAASALRINTPEERTLRQEYQRNLKARAEQLRRDSFARKSETGKGFIGASLPGVAPGLERDEMWAFAKVGFRNKWEATKRAAGLGLFHSYGALRGFEGPRPYLAGLVARSMSEKGYNRTYAKWLRRLRDYAYETDGAERGREKLRGTLDQMRGMSQVQRLAHLNKLLRKRHIGASAFDTISNVPLLTKLAFAGAIIGGATNPWLAMGSAVAAGVFNIPYKQAWEGYKEKHNINSVWGGIKHFGGGFFRLSGGLIAAPFRLLGAIGQGFKRIFGGHGLFGLLGISGLIAGLRQCVSLASDMEQNWVRIRATIGTSAASTEVLAAYQRRASISTGVSAKMYQDALQMYMTLDREVNLPTADARLNEIYLPYARMMHLDSGTHLNSFVSAVRGSAELVGGGRATEERFANLYAGLSTTAAFRDKEQLVQAFTNIPRLIGGYGEFSAPEEIFATVAALASPHGGKGGKDVTAIQALYAAFDKGKNIDKAARLISKMSGGKKVYKDAQDMLKQEGLIGSLKLLKALEDKIGDKHPEYTMKEMIGYETGKISNRELLDLERLYETYLQRFEDIETTNQDQLKEFKNSFEYKWEELKAPFLDIAKNIGIIAIDWAKKYFPALRDNGAKIADWVEKNREKINNWLTTKTDELIAFAKKVKEWFVDNWPKLQRGWESTMLKVSGILDAISHNWLFQTQGYKDTQKSVGGVKRILENKSYTTEYADKSLKYEQDLWRKRYAKMSEFDRQRFKYFNDAMTGSANDIRKAFAEGRISADYDPTLAPFDSKPLLASSKNTANVTINYHPTVTVSTDTPTDEFANMLKKQKDDMELQMKKAIYGSFPLPAN